MAGGRDGGSACGDGVACGYIVAPRGREVNGDLSQRVPGRRSALRLLLEAMRVTFLAGIAQVAWNAL